MLWSASKQTWHERFGAALFIGSAGAFIWALVSLPLPAQILFGAAFLALTAWLLGRGWLRIVGPVFLTDLVRKSRRRVIGPRTLYVCLLLLGFISICALISDDARRPFWTLFSGANIPTEMLAAMAFGFSAAVLVAQFSVACGLAPIVGAAIPQEKQRQTLDFLLATDLRNHEIVLGILLSRLAQIGLLILAGLPIFCLLQLLGGIEPILVFVAFGVTALTMTSLASLAVLISIYVRRPLGAILATYGLAALYLVPSAAAKSLVHTYPLVARFPSTATWSSPITADEAVAWLNIGNPGTALFDIVFSMEQGLQLENLLLPVLESYCWFHGVLIVVCVVWASARIRVVALRQAGIVARRKATNRARRRAWGLDRWPLLWKEMHARRDRGVRIFNGLLVLAGVGSVLVILGAFACTIPFVPWRELKLVMNLWMRVAGMVLLGLMLVQTAAKAASSVSGERDQQTLDMLLTTPQSARNILFAKWLGSIISTWRTWLWLGVVWVSGWFTGAVAPEAIPYLFLATGVLVMAVASMAVWVSSNCPTTARALSSTFILILLLWAGHWAWFPLAEWLLDSPRWNLEWLWKLQLYTLTPPLAFDHLASKTYVIGEQWRSQYLGARLAEFDEITDFCWLGLAFWFSVGIAFFCWAEIRFAAAVGRRRRALPSAPPRDEPRLAPALALATKD